MKINREQIREKIIAIIANTLRLPEIKDWNLINQIVSFVESITITQPEGLCLMWYKCEKCSKEERVWNSRPRVTPFGIFCLSCEGTMYHKDWNLDEYAPNHIPQKGERVFIDWSKESAAIHYKKYIENHWNDKDYPMSKVFENKDKAFEYYMNQWKFGDPTIEVI